MADNYTEFSTVVRVKTSAIEELKELELALDEPEESSNIKEWMLPHIEDLVVRVLDYGNFNVNVDFTPTDGESQELLVYSECNGDVEGAALYLQALLRCGLVVEPDQHIILTWANTCSRPLPDEFSGGMCIITKNQIYWRDDEEWVHSIIQQITKENKNAT